jgi:hypothetical protein
MNMSCREPAQQAAEHAAAKVRLDEFRPQDFINTPFEKFLRPATGRSRRSEIGQALEEVTVIGSR